MSLPTRNIGGVPVGEIGFGVMGIAWTVYGELENDEERFKVRPDYIDCSSIIIIPWAGLGCSSRERKPPLGHSARLSIQGDSETLIGKWFKRTGKRGDIFLATKGAVKGVTPNGSREFVREQVQTSLTRLGVDCIDLYYIHRVDPTTPIEVTIAALKELIQEGKIKSIGISECSAKTLRRAHAVHPIAALQAEYSPFVLDIERPEIGLLEACRELGVTIVAYSPLGRGLLTGRFKSLDDLPEDDFRRGIPMFSKENFSKILALVADIEKIGKNHNATSGQVALAWVLAQGKDFVVIPGTKNVKYIKENIGGASSALQLSAEEIAELRRMAEAIQEELPGPRYPEMYMEGFLADTVELAK
ncbi:Aldo-keto reductase [Mycena kentingensis (nom. inval.)]|nr:Aldo-keto reductase [Mycena kentingensis (nom. inval.)]